MQRDLKLLEDDLTPEEIQDLRNKRTGMFIFQVSWIMAFMCLVVVNWQLSFSRDWLPEGAERMSLLPATFATAALLLSAFLGRRALQAIREDDRPGFMGQWAASLALGGLFVLVMLYEWVAIGGTSAAGTQYAQVFRLMTGFHMVHAVAIGGYMISVWQNAREGSYGSLDFWAVEAGLKLWYFVFIAWMVFYTVIYFVAW